MRLAGGVLQYTRTKSAPARLSAQLFLIQSTVDFII